MENKDKIIKIQNPVTGTYYAIRKRKIKKIEGSRGTILGKWKPKYGKR